MTRKPGPLEPTQDLPPPPRATGDRVGETLDNRYRLVQVLGRGGMGAVYLARHVALGRPVAVKILDEHRSADAQGVQRLFREARTAAAIGHPNIVDVFDVGTAPSGQPYLVMEHLDGEDLGSWMSRHIPVSVAAACALLEPILRALHAAHQQGVVHRDLKPSNVFIVRRPDCPPTLKLIDFGIAKLMGTVEGKLTTTGALLGTPSYMSPEQAVGLDDVDARVDVYAAGVILFELLTGQLPFEGTNYNQLLYRIVRDEAPAAESLAPGLPEDVGALIRRATRKVPGERFQSVEEMLGALEQLPAWADRYDAMMDLATSVRSLGEVEAATLASAGAPPPLARQVLSTVRGGHAAPRVEVRDATGRQRRLYRWGGLAALGVALGGSVMVWEQVAPQAEHGGEQAPPSSQPEPDEVEITLVGLPPGAKVHFDGASIVANPFRVPRTRTVMSLRVDGNGREPFVATVVPTENLTIHVRLGPVRPAPSGRSAAAASSKPVGVASAPPFQPKSRATASSKPVGVASAPPSQPQSHATTSASSTSPLRHGGRGTYYSDRFE